MILDTSSFVFWFTLFLCYLFVVYIITFFSGIIGVKRSADYNLLDSIEAGIMAFICYMMITTL